MHVFLNTGHKHIEHQRTITLFFDKSSPRLWMHLYKCSDLWALRVVILHKMALLQEITLIVDQVQLITAIGNEHFIVNLQERTFCKLKILTPQICRVLQLATHLYNMVFIPPGT